MNSYLVKRKSNQLLALFVVGLLAHIVSVRFLIRYLGPLIAEWTNGVAQTVITVYVIHSLAQLFRKNAHNLWPVDRKTGEFTTFTMLLLFWLTFAVHMAVWPFSLTLLKITGWIAFGASLLAIAVLYGRNRFYLIREMRHAEPV